MIILNPWKCIKTGSCVCLVWWLTCIVSNWFTALCGCCSTACVVLHRVLGVRHGCPAVKVTVRSVRVWPLRPPPRWPLPHDQSACLNTLKTRGSSLNLQYRFENCCHCLSVSLLSECECLSLVLSLSSFVLKLLPTKKKKKALSVKLKAFSHTINIHTRKCICWISFSLTTCSHLRWSLRPSLAANLVSALFLSLDWLLRWWPQRVTCGAPGSPLAGPTLAPDAAKYRGAAVISPDKRANIPCSPLMSPAKRTGSTLGPLGFIYPFFLALQRVDRGVKFVRCLSCDRLTTSHTHTAFQIPKRASCCILLIHVVGFHILRAPLKRYVWERFLAGMNQPQYNLKAFSKKPSHVNAASQAREWLKLKGRLSSLNPKIGIPVLLEILSSTCRREEKEVS